MDVKPNALPIERLAVIQFATDNGDEQTINNRVMDKTLYLKTVGDLVFKKVLLGNGKIQFEKWYETGSGTQGLVYYKNESGFKKAIKRAIDSYEQA